MKAVILVGGEGTRLRPLTCTTTKAVVPVLNRPFLEHVLHYLRGHGIEHTILTLCYLPDQIKGYFGLDDSAVIKVSYALEESPLGTAGAVKNAEAGLDQPFFVLNGDIFTSLDLTAMMAFHRERKAKVTIALTPVEDPTAYGLVETDDRGRIKRFLEKPSWDEVTTNMINAGIYILEPEVLTYITPQTFCMFEHNLFPMLLDLGQPLYGFASHDYWIDIGSPQKYLKLNHDLLLGRCPGFEHRVSESSSIHPKAQIKGPVVIGSDSKVGAEALIQGPTVIGSGCSIGRGAIVESSVLWSDVQVEEKAILSNCIVGNNCRIGEESCIGEGSVLSDNVIVRRGIKLKPGTPVWPGVEVEDEAGNFGPVESK